MRSAVLATLVFAAAGFLFGQSDRGTITGTVTDPAGAVVAGAMVQARNVDTGGLYPAATSATGNYTIAQLPAGNYELTVTVAGFKTLTRPGLLVQAAQTIRVDASLQVGNATESVTVNAEAPLLQTESGELSNTVSTATLDALPLQIVGSNSSGIRNPFNVVALMPGAYYQPKPPFTGPVVEINGAPAGSERLVIEGMDATNIMGQGANQENQPGSDSIQEFTVQTSNYSAEYGQAGGAVVNVTMKSGTNQYHGSGFEIYQNEFLNAGQPFTSTSKGLLRPSNRRNDYGLTLGGPVVIPKVYNGKDKTFFFFNWEQYLQTFNDVPSAFSVPTPAYRTGNFAGAVAAAGNHNLGLDPLGRTIFANQIYDPSTRHLVNGVAVTDPFAGNIIPGARLDPVASRIQSMIPQPFCVAGFPCNALGAVNNYQNTELVSRDTETPSLKIDQLLGSKDKLSFFWGHTGTYTQNGYGEDGLPQPIGYSFGANIYSNRERLNYDRTMTPTVLLHLGAGYDAVYLGRPSVTPQYNACTGIGLCSSAFSLGTFPSFTGLSNSTGGGFGGFNPPQIGPPGRVDNANNVTNAIASVTWVKGNHTFKFGANGEFMGSYNLGIANNLQGTYGFSSAQTALPYLVNTSTGTSTSSLGPYSVGFPYASFLLGGADTYEVDPPYASRFGKQQWGFYGQDSWKVTRKLTLDIGLRYDYNTYYTEEHGRAPNFDPTLANPSAGGYPGAVTYQAICHCAFAHNYPFAFGPRFGFAYQLTPKTVLRGGAGIEYTPTGVGQTFSNASGTAFPQNANAPSSIPGNAIMTLGQGPTINGAPLTPGQIAWPNYSPGFYPVAGVLPGLGPQYYDPNAGRPARQYQYSFTIQREVIPNLEVQAAYIGNRGIWWPQYLGNGPGTSGALVNYNYLSNAILAANGLSLSNPADVAMLAAPLNSPAAGRFAGKVPFAGFPLTQSVAQSLRPFPQFNTNCNPPFPQSPSGPCPVSAPLGDSWYNSLQLQANKRFSHGLQFNFSFVWSRAENTFGGTPDVQNRELAKTLSSFDQPFVTRFGVTYETPKWGPDRIVKNILGGWQLDAIAYYASGIPLLAPVTNTAGYGPGLFQATMNNITFQTGQYQVRVPGQPLYLQDPNCHCFDPNTTFVLNPKAWTDPGVGQYGGASYYNDFRGERRPVENFGFGREFRFRESMALTLRAEFTNIFNRTYLNDPALGGFGVSPQTAPVCKTPGGTNGACVAGEQIVSGFGSIATSSVYAQPRTGQLMAKFVF